MKAKSITWWLQQGYDALGKIALPSSPACSRIFQDEAGWVDRNDSAYRSCAFNEFKRETHSDLQMGNGRCGVGREGAVSQLLSVFKASQEQMVLEPQSLKPPPEWLTLLPIAVNMEANKCQVKI